MAEKVAIALYVGGMLLLVFSFFKFRRKKGSILGERYDLRNKLMTLGLTSMTVGFTIACVY